MSDSLPEPSARAPSGLFLALSGFGLGVLSFVLWATLRLPAPLVGVLAVAIAWLGLRRASRANAAPGDPGVRLARWGFRLGLLKLALFVGFLLVFGVATLSQLGV